MKSESPPIFNYDNPVINFLLNTKYRLLQHALFIITIILLVVLPTETPFFLEQAIAQDKEFQRVYETYSYLLGVLFVGSIYLNLYVLIPRFLYRADYFVYMLCVVLVGTVFYFFSFVIDRNILSPLNATYAALYSVKFSMVDFLSAALLPAVLIGATTGLKVFKKWVFDNRRINELEKNNLQVELDQLKSQVNPHFLFNTLNNLHTLIQTDSKTAAEVVLGLSDLLRYQLYDSSKEKVYLAKDIEFIKRVLELEKIRKDNFNYALHVKGNINGQMLNPFLFMPFVENAIKHGLNTIEHCTIEILFTVSSRSIEFAINNTKPALAYKNFEQGGLGLKNVQRRLELLYPNKHELTLEDEKNNYSVKLYLQI
jgi:sensor histidine kinase YesM